MVGISLVFLVMAAIPVLMVAALVDILRRPADEWTDSGQSQLAWVLLVVLLTLLGVVMYFAVARPRLEDAASISHPA